MTVKETRDYFEQMVMGNGLYPLQPICQRDMEMTKIALNALEKQIPKKVIKQTEDDREFIDYVCPNCKTILQQKNKQAKRITIYKYKHCIECGQALDWSDTE